ncbi:hypothetical protein BE04_39490 [Sorangium cellulosum]|uniref:Uncharacterized protein n=1 Tax=Sorangium cellulosum TaxID=56 RepID=A0A150PQ58_SORCE|nr:hypothetical protein BE04_39490 [Sorangium cellulosum]
MTLGGIFQQNALAPIHWAEQMLRRQQVAEMLNTVCADRLAAALANGAKAVARAAGVGEQLVHGILPVNHGTELLGRVAISQQGAVEVWNQHQSSLAGLVQGFLGGFFEGYLGIEGSGVGDFLAQLAGGFARDARFRGPMQELVQRLTEYEQYVHHCAALLDANPDLERAWRASKRRTALGWTTAVLAVVTIGFGLWRHVVRDALATSSGATSAPIATTSATMPSIAPLLGRWRAEDGNVLEAIAQAGAGVRFLVVSTGPSSWYKPGDVAFTTTSSNDGNNLQVEVLVKPALPAGVRLDSAAQARCIELWSDLQGKPLRAALDGDRLTVEGIKLDVPVTGLDLHGGRVVGCKKFDPARAAKIALTLTRTPTQ